VVAELRSKEKQEYLAAVSRVRVRGCVDFVRYTATRSTHPLLVGETIAGARGCVA
jgi:hypothetical protein